MPGPLRPHDSARPKHLTEWEWENAIQGFGTWQGQGKLKTRLCQPLNKSSATVTNLQAIQLYLDLPTAVLFGDIGGFVGCDVAGLLVTGVFVEGFVTGGGVESAIR